jgi:hypothetical protein
MAHLTLDPQRLATGRENRKPWKLRSQRIDEIGRHHVLAVVEVGLGCDLRHASRLIYARGLDLHDPAAATPIGMSCKVCERPRCPQRAFPAIGRTLDSDEHLARYEPYASR